MVGSGKNINENATLIIKYYDSLLSFKTVYKKHLQKKKDINELDSLLYNGQNILTHNHKYTIETYDSSKKKWAKKKNKCIKKIEKLNNSHVSYLYGNAENKNLGYPDFNWIKDRGVFKNNFFKISFNFGLLILKPDGEYFLSGSHFTDKMVKQLLKNADWNDYKKDLYASYGSNSSSSDGFFSNDYRRTYHKKHCF
jgi:hypothetical protein